MKTASSRAGWVSLAFSLTSHSSGEPAPSGVVDLAFFVQPVLLLDERLDAPEHGPVAGLLVHRSSFHGSLLMIVGRPTNVGQPPNTP